MAWITLTTDMVKTRLAGAELSAYQTAALATGQADPLPEILLGVTREVRARVAACRSNRLGFGQTIPDELEHHALAIVRYRLLTRLPVPIKEERKTEYQDALTALGQVAKCEFVIEAPETVTDEEVYSPTPRMTSKTRNYRRTDQDGI